MNPSLPFGPPDAFYFEAFTQDEAFMALDAENRRRGFGTAPTSAHAAHATSSSCTSYPAPLKRLSQSVDNSMHCMPAAAGQQKRARQPEQPPPDPNLLFVRPWCREEVRVGRAAAVRKYVAASYLSMWERTQASLANSRHFYEIVRDSTPCHIYFDLEFATADNRKVDRNAMVDCLLNIVASLVKVTWGIDIGPQNVLEMESTNPSKFSRHVVIWLPNAAFQSGPDLGKFVKDAVLQHKAAHTLQIKSGESMMPIVDTSVYSRNRCFRCLFSSKAPSGGSPPAGSPFQLSGRYPPIGWTLPLPHQWLSSLVCHTPPSATLLQFSARELSAVSNLLIAKPTMLPPPGRAPMSGPASGRQQGYAAPFTVVDLDGLIAAELSVQVKWLFGAQATPERIDLLRRATPYMLDYARQMCGCDVRIKKVCVLGSRGLVAFDLDGPGGRYCSWEKKCHRSNFSLLKVDFWHGTFAHQCWDPVCKSKYQRLWNVHNYQLPDALQRYQHLFQDPEEFDPNLEELLVASDGGSVAKQLAGLRSGPPAGFTTDAARTVLGPVPLPAARSPPGSPTGGKSPKKFISEMGWNVVADSPVFYRS